MKVFTSTIGYYGIHYKSEQAITIGDSDIRPIDCTKKVYQTLGFTPMLASKTIIIQHDLPSAVIWIQDESR
jgi:hypothetical protein